MPISNWKEETATHRTAAASYSAVVCATPCWFTSILVGQAGNDPEITLYDSAVAPTPGTTEEKAPTTTVDVSALGFNGLEKGHNSWCVHGLWLTVTAPGGGAYGGTCDIVVGYNDTDTHLY